MQQKTTHCLFTFIFLFIFIIPTVSATSTVIDERNAMCFHYAVLHENDHFKWNESQDNAI